MLRATHQERLGGLIFHGLLLLLLLTRLISPYDLLLLFWIELLLLGVFAVLKMIVALVLGDPFSGRYVDSSGGATLLFGAMALGFFVLKFGGILAGFGFLLFWLPLSGEELPVDLGELGPWIGLSFWYLLGAYAFSFIWQFLRHKEYQRVSVVWLLFSPYLRGVVIGITLLVASAASTYFQGHAYLAFCLVLVIASGILSSLQSR